MYINKPCPAPGCTGTCFYQWGSLPPSYYYKVLSYLFWKKWTPSLHAIFWYYLRLKYTLPYSSRSLIHLSSSISTIFIPFMVPCDIPNDLKYTNVTSEWILRECQQSWALGMRQHFNTQNRHGPNPEYNYVILVFVTPRIT